MAKHDIYVDHPELKHWKSDSLLLNRNYFYETYIYYSDEERESFFNDLKKYKQQLNTLMPWYKGSNEVDYILYTSLRIYLDIFDKALQQKQPVRWIKANSPLQGDDNNIVTLLVIKKLKKEREERKNVQ